MPICSFYSTYSSKFIASVAEEYVQKSPGSISDHCRYPAQGRDPNYQDRGVDDADPTISKSRSHESQLFNLTSSNGKNPTSSNFTFPW